jgi:hypothetical protein
MFKFAADELVEPTTIGLKVRIVREYWPEFQAELSSHGKHWKFQSKAQGGVPYQQ